MRIERRIKMNYMKQVAEMLGVEMGERFDIKYPARTYEDYFFDDLGLKSTEVVFSPVKLNDIINGNAEIIKKPFRPKYNEGYWIMRVDGNPEYNKFDGGTYDLMVMYMGNCFRTIPEAEAHKDEIMAKFREMMDDDRA